MAANRKLTNYASAVVWMTLGSVTVIGSVAWMNKSNEPPERQKVSQLQAIEIKKQVKPKPKLEKRIRKKPPKMDRTPPPEFKGLDSSLSGIDVGIPAFDVSDMSDLNDSLLEGGDEDVVMTSNSVDNPPKIRRQAPVIYPERAKSEGLEGYVLLNLLIDKNGKVKKVRILESKPAEIFDEYAKQGISQWEFEPATYKGKRVKVWAQQKVRFDLS